MKDLIIVQNESLVENVSSSVIDKLYQIALDFENNVSLSGNIQAISAYEDAIQYLTAKFPNLHINVPNNNYYIRFTDPVFERICKEKWSSDGIGVTSRDLSKVTTINSDFSDINITTLVDLKHLNANLITIPKNDPARTNGIYSTRYIETEIQEKFGSAYTNATHGNPLIINEQTPFDIEMPNININIVDGSFMVGSHQSKLKIAINSVKWNNALISATYQYTIPCIYCRCSFEKWDDSLVPNMTNFSNFYIFLGCNIDKVIFREGITKITDNFNSCDIPYIVYPSTITDIGDMFFDFRRDAQKTVNNTGAIVIKAVNPPSTGNSAPVDYNNKYPQYIYVPDGSVDRYKSETNGRWQYTSISSRITPMSQMPQFLREELGVTQEDIDRT